MRTWSERWWRWWSWWRGWWGRWGNGRWGRRQPSSTSCQRWRTCSEETSEVSFFSPFLSFWVCWNVWTISCPISPSIKGRPQSKEFFCNRELCIQFYVICVFLEVGFDLYVFACVCVYSGVLRFCVCVRDSFVEWGELGGGVMKWHIVINCKPFVTHCTLLVVS